MNNAAMPSPASSPLGAYASYNSGNSGYIEAIGLDIGIRIDASSQVPAPATLALFGLGLAGLGWSRRKKSK